MEAKETGDKYMASKFNSIHFNQGSSKSAHLSVGSAIEVTEKVAKGDLSSAIALVGPPGLHAEHNKATCFCQVNNVAVAANFLLNKPELGVGKILIVDWDVHNGNGTQKIFYDDSRVLLLSMHRYETGELYPFCEYLDNPMIGEGPGQGFNINVPWEDSEDSECGDADFLAVRDHVLIPVAESFNPDIILVSAGFGIAAEDPLGECGITPRGYALLLEMLKRLAQGKLVLFLEGGYNLSSVTNSVLASAHVLLGDICSFGKLDTRPFESTWRSIKAVRNVLKSYWPELSGTIPREELKNPRDNFYTELHGNSVSDSEDDMCVDQVNDEISAVQDFEAQCWNEVDLEELEDHVERLRQKYEQACDALQASQQNYEQTRDALQACETAIAICRFKF